MANNGKAPTEKKRFFSSFKYAARGMRLAFLKGRNIRIFVIIAVIALLAGYFLKISTIEWLFLIFTIGVTFGSELFNTALEVLGDKITLKKDAQIAVVKDIAAAAVLTLSVMSVAVGLVIFLPRIIQLFQ